jgi:putative ABC transport system permease protein
MPLDLVWGDVRLAWRSVVRRPAFTILIVMTLALGIGVNSAVFALLDGVLLRPLPYRDPARLVFVWQTLPEHNVFELEPTVFDYDAWHAVRSFSEIALVATDAFTLTGDDNPERIRGARVTASLMPMLGLQPQIGRGFTAAEDTDASAPVVVLGDGIWRRRYGADPAVVGRAIQVNGEPRTIVGIMPRGASLPGPLAGDDELWLPARMSAAEQANAISHNYTVIARLADGTTLTAASAEIVAFAARMVAEHPDTHRKIGARLVGVTDQTTRAIRPALLVVGGGVALLLLVACANAVTLLLARAANRSHEMAIRTALGATASRLLSLAVVESCVFAMLAGAVGLILGSWALRGLLPLLGANLPQSLSIAVDARAALFTAGIAAVAGLVFGVVVAAHRPGRLADALRSGTRTTAGAHVARTRNALVVGQVALAVILLSAAGLMLSSVAKLARVRPGFDTDRIATFKIAMTGSRYAPDAARIAYAGELVERLSATPGVQGAALTSIIPFGGTRGANGVEIEGRPRQPNEISMIVDQRHVSPGYFRTMGIAVLRGRAFAASDDVRAERVVVINKTMAGQYWPDENPIGRRVRLSGGYDSGIWMRIVGVVDDVRHISLSRGPVPEMYHPYGQAAVPLFTVVVRTDRDPATIVPIARSAMLALDANLPMYDARTMDDRVKRSFAPTRGTMLLLLVTAALAAALSAVAIYGSIWYSVTERLPEIGIRLALGATRASVCLRVVSRAVAAARRKDASEPPHLARAPEEQRRRLSYAQTRLWFLDRLEPDSAAYNIGFTARIRGAVDARSSARAVVARADASALTWRCEGVVLSRPAPRST